MPVRSKDQICKPILLKNGNIKMSNSRQQIYLHNKICKPSYTNQFLKKRTIMTTPTSDISENLGIHRSLSSSYSRIEYRPIEELPALNSVPEEKFNELLRKKLGQCCKICNFSNSMADLKSKNLKAKYLKEILFYFLQPHFFDLIEPETFEVFFRMLKCNIIRSMPPIPEFSKLPIIDDEIKDTLSEASWCHLEIIYQIFQKYLEYDQIDYSLVTKYIDSKLIYQFLMTFNSFDQRERSTLKMVLHKIYAKFINQRIIIRKAIHHVFYTYLYETKFFCGMNELLEIIASIVNGYFVPLKKEHKNFLIKLLLPLYTSNHLLMFQTSLLRCINQYIQKDHQLISVIISKLLSYWPITFTTKEICFINHIEKIFEHITDIQFVQIMEPLCERIGKCIVSNNFQVCEAAMLLWKNDKFAELTIFHSDKLFPIVSSYLYQTGTNHWNTSIRNLSVSIIRIFMELSHDVFENYNRSMNIHEQQKLHKLAEEKNKWMMIINAAAKNDSSINENEKIQKLNEIFPELQKMKK